MSVEVAFQCPLPAAAAPSNVPADVGVANISTAAPYKQLLQ